MAIFLLILLLLWVPLAAPIYLWVGDRNAVSIITMALLYGEFIFLVRLWGKRVYGQPRVLQGYGLKLTRQNGLELLAGLGLGLVSILSMLTVQELLGWLDWRLPGAFRPVIIPEGLLVALAVGFAEELCFRGWLLDELQRDYTIEASLWLDAFLFALLHFIKPLLEMIRTAAQFPGLLLLGLNLVWAKRSTRGRLGFPIGLHGGLVWGYYIVNVGQLLAYSPQVPTWVTGIDGNPLAGLVGLISLGAIAVFLRMISRRYNVTHTPPPPPQP
ncbi:MAG: CPBP family intramembrane metalloprotease [Hormoscilla sp. SP12CHS1]|nr:CPBP family intramembrane metalloprotease [Hormoscilla sp. SP12CHS1]